MGKEWSSSRFGRRKALDVALTATALTSASLAAFPMLRVLEPAPGPVRGSVSLGKLEEIPRGTAIASQLDGSPILLLHTLKGELRAFSAVCPHLGCVVRHDPAAGLRCRCHGGRFADDGRNAGGPPTRPLERLVVNVEEGEVLVRRAGSKRSGRA